MLDKGCHDALESLGYDLRTILYCDNNKHAQEVLKARMQDGNIHPAPIWSDVTTLHITKLRGHVDCIIAGFPCQPFSFAGKRAGIQDQRYLFADIIRLANEGGVSVLLLENVPGLLSAKKEATAPISDVMRLLAEAGFNAAWQCVCADDAEVKAPHKRERVFIIAWRTASAEQELDDSPETRF
jgi:DNA (cytosine-5)-methyltransferase 1